MIFFNWQEEKPKHIPIPVLYPMGALTFAIACSHCKNVGGGEICRLCKQEVASGFELKEKKPGRWLFHSARRTDLLFECSECGAITSLCGAECKLCGSKMEVLE